LFKKYTSLALIMGALYIAPCWAEADDSALLLSASLDSLSTACSATVAADLSAQSVAQLQEFYQRLDYTPLWQDAARRQQLIELILDTRYDGLNPAQYPLPQALSLEQATWPQQQACDEILYSHSYLKALRHLRDGVLVQAQVEPYWYEAEVQPAVPQPIAEVAATGVNDLSGTFAKVRPQHSAYQKLREVLKSSYLLTQPDWGQVPSQGRSMRVGEQDRRIPRLRERLQIAGYLPQQQDEVVLLDTSVDEHTELSTPVNPLRYDEALLEAVKTFQQDHYLEEDGIVGPATLRELNISPAQRLLQVRANLERLRWLDKLMEPDMLVVDIAGARLLYFSGGDIVWRTRTQVGTVRRQTPLLKSRITHLTINPTWTVPPTILREDKLPEIRRDISYLTRSNMSVLDYQGNRLDPYSIDWRAPTGIMLRQGPGPSNALGLVAIRFANPFTVYLHDTPSKHIFGRATRTVSSGCVRVEDAQKLVDLLLLTATDEERERIARIQASGKTRNVNLPQPVPVLLAYWTVEVDMDNRLRFRSDSYARDMNIIEALMSL